MLLHRFRYEHRPVGPDDGGGGRVGHVVPVVDRTVVMVVPVGGAEDQCEGGDHVHRVVCSLVDVRLLACVYGTIVPGL